MAFNQEEYINQKVSQSLGDNMINAVYNLSYLLGDEKGKITKSTAEAALIGLQILPPGVVVASELTDITLDDETDDGSPILENPAIPVESFIPEISPKAYAVFSGLKVKDSNMVNSTVSNKSPLLSSLSKFNIRTKSGVNIIFIESLALYLELLDASVETGLASVTKSDISRIDTNIRFVTRIMEHNKTTLDYALLENLRRLQRTLMYIRYQDFLFVSTYNDRVIELNTYMEDLSL